MHLRRLTSVLALLLAFSLVAPAVATAADGASAPAPAPGGVAGSVVTVQLTHDGLQRSYRVFRPTRLAAGPRPVVLALHGQGQTGSSFEQLTALDAGAVKQGALVVYPDGLNGSWNAGTCCVPGATAGTDDLGFLDAVLDDVARRYAVDAARTAVVGWSAGGMMALRYGCERSVRVDMVAVAGATFAGSACDLTRPVSLLQLHGLADKVVPLNGTSTSTLSATGSLAPVKGAVSGLAIKAGCGAFSTVTWTSAPLVQNTLASGCPTGTSIDFVTSKPLAHLWPTGKSHLAAYGVDMTNMTWSVVGQHWASAGPVVPLVPAVAAPAVPAGCEGTGQRVVPVKTADELHAALADATPGDRILLADGTYNGIFAAKRAGTSTARITLCGTSAAVLNGGSVINPGYVLWLTAGYWDVSGITLTNGQKGIMLDDADHNVLDRLTVHTIGDEGIHFRKGSSDNVLSRSTIHDTGKREPKYGEGVYVGSSVNNWCTLTACAPDASDRNTIRDNRIFRTAAEAMDLKEGTTGGLVERNTMDGTGSKAAAWVNVKGNSWTIRGNSGRVSLLDGYRTEVQATGWAKNNVFVGNTADVQGPGYGFNVHAGNTVGCDNVVTAAASGTSTLTCLLGAVGLL